MCQKLTKTQDVIVRYKMLGLQRKEIADRMHRSLDTIAVHFRNIYEKTDVQNEIELYNWYAENVLKIDIRKMIQVIVLIFILSPSIIGHSNDLQRTQRSVRSARSSRTSRRSDFDSNYLFN